jgi:peptide-methionine (R)-S-oxide reductase
MNRRQFLGGTIVAAAGAGLVAWPKRPIAIMARSAPPRGDEVVTVVRFSDAGEKLGPEKVKKVYKSDAEWQKQLNALQFQVTRQQGTEQAFTGEYAESTDQGLYRCVCCHNALFSSDTKFDSGTGWPSFWAPIAKENVQGSRDSSLAMTRDEVHCTECDGHLGHVFDDGPRPTGLRYCMNSASLRFVKHG